MGTSQMADDVQRGDGLTIELKVALSSETTVDHVWWKQELGCELIQGSYCCGAAEGEV
jgi:hypothetical protein